MSKFFESLVMLSGRMVVNFWEVNLCSISLVTFCFYFTFRTSVSLFLCIMYSFLLLLLMSYKGKTLIRLEYPTQPFIRVENIKYLFNHLLIIMKKFMNCHCDRPYPLKKQLFQNDT